MKLARHVVCGLSALLLATTAAGNEPSQAVRNLLDDLQSIDRQLQQQLRRAQTAAATGQQSEAGLSQVVEHYTRALENLRLAAHRLHDDSSAALQAKVDQLSSLVDKLNRSAPTGIPVSALPSLARPSKVAHRTLLSGQLVPANDDCSDALSVVDGTWVGDTTTASNDGEATCGSSLDSPDVWFRYVAGSSGWLGIDTIGSSYDTVLSVHSECPGACANQLACIDDAVALHSAVAVELASGDEILIRVSGFGGSAGPFVVNIGATAGISGRVTDAESHVPISNIRVKLFDEAGYHLRTGTTDDSGSYSISGLVTGPYYVATARRVLNYFGEIYHEIPCPREDGYRCDPTTGVPVTTAPGTMTTGIDFTLDLSGAVSGRVTDDDTGDPIDGAKVEVILDHGYMYDYTEADGTYLIWGFTSDSHYILARSASYQDELYRDVPCESRSCLLTDGEQITVNIGATTTVDFALERQASISGTMTSRSTGNPVRSIIVSIFRNDGTYVDQVSSQEDGSYTIAGLTAGTYYALSESYYYATELFDAIICESDCDVSSGTPIVVAAQAAVTGIDFALTRRGNISGRVTEQATGDPVPTLVVGIYDTMGHWVASPITDFLGFYSVSGLAAGSYFVTATDPEYLDEVYNGIVCNPLCTITNGTPVAVALGTRTEGIDFALARLAVITGTVTVASSGEPIDTGFVEARPISGGESFSSTLDSQGRYRLTGLPHGRYYVATRSSSIYADEVWDDVPCLPSGCVEVAGTPVIAHLNSMTTSIDFALDHGGVVTGTVTSAASGEPISQAMISLHDHTGVLIDSFSSDDSGVWRAEGLAAGTCFATAQGPGHVGGLYDGLPCGQDPDRGCDPTTGTPIVVTTGTTTAGVDFELPPLGAISGVVTDAATGEPLAGVVVEIFETYRSSVAQGVTDASGLYLADRIPAGDYFAKTKESASLYANEVYEDIQCYRCDPTSGTPIPVTVSATTTGIDFSLDRLGGISGSIRDDLTGELIKDTSIGLEAYDQSGRDWYHRSRDGKYLISDLYPGTYYVTAGVGIRYLTELYDDIACPDWPVSLCDESKGQPIVVTAGTTVTGIDFSLSFANGISATVTDTDSGAPLAGIQVDVWSQDGSLADSVLTDSDGWCLVPLREGAYYLSTHSSIGYTDEVYNNLLCPAGSAFAGGCDPFSGDPIEVIYYEIADGIEIELGTGIFNDGFESGDTARWSTSIN
jgi:5-hydroxyisourate hydrolase-like protein (transthyretin family)